MHVRQNQFPSEAPPPPAAAPEPSAPKDPCSPSLKGFMGGGYGLTDGRRHPPASRPWFYPVVEQHDVTYHRVKPLTWHRRQTHNAKPNGTYKNEKNGKKNDDVYRRDNLWRQQNRGGWIQVRGGRNGGQECCRWEGGVLKEATLRSK